MNFILWIIFGALVGWIASMITGRNEQQGAIGNIIVGLVGALLGGWIFEAFGGSGVTGFNLSSLLVALVGATLLLFIYNSIKRDHPHDKATGDKI